MQSTGTWLLASRQREGRTNATLPGALAVPGEAAKALADVLVPILGATEWGLLFIALWQRIGDVDVMVSGSGYVNYGGYHGIYPKDLVGASRGNGTCVGCPGSY